MEPDQQGQEAVQEHEACAEAGVCDDGQHCTKYVNAGYDRQEEHGRDAANEGKPEEEAFPEAAVVGGAGHGNDEQGLDQDGDTEGIHGKACRIYLESQDVDDTLSLFWVMWSEQGGEAGGGRDGGHRGLARRGVVMDQNTILAGELLEGDGDEGPNAAYYEDLGVLVRLPLAVVNLVCRWSETALSWK